VKMRGEWLNVQNMMDETGYVYESLQAQKQPMKVGRKRSQSERSMGRWE